MNAVLCSSPEGLIPHLLRGLLTNLSCQPSLGITLGGKESPHPGTCTSQGQLSSNDFGKQGYKGLATSPELRTIPKAIITPENCVLIRRAFPNNFLHPYLYLSTCSSH